jgi:glutaredoxin
MTLYITTECSICDRVREALDEVAFAHNVVTIPRGERSDRLPAGTEPPVLVDNGTVVQGGPSIFAYIEELERLKREWLKYQSDACYCE